MKKSIVVFVAICMSLLLITPSFAATSQTQDNHTETVLECVSTIDENEEVISLNNVEIIDSLDDVNIDGEAGHPISSLSKAASYVTPVLIRSGDTTSVELYLKYSGNRANSIRFKKLVVESTVVGKNYKVFKPATGKTYKTINFTGSTNATVYIGKMSVPKSKSRAIVRTTGLQVYEMSRGWLSFTEIGGSWSIK